MNEIVNFVKEILMLERKDNTPVGLCSFDRSEIKKTKRIKQTVKREPRLSELMDR